MLFTTETALNPPFIDLHTHRRTTASGVVAVSNFSQKDLENGQNTEGSLFASVGLHPWFLTKENFENDFEKLSQLVDSNDARRGSAPMRMKVNKRRVARGFSREKH